MTENEIKKTLLDQGIKVADIAAAMADQFPITKGSADVMLRHLISGQRWYPAYAEWLKTNYGLIVEKPVWIKPVRERLRQQAA